MDELIERLQSIKDEVKEIKSCVIVVKLKDDYTIKMITNEDWGVYEQEL